MESAGKKRSKGSRPKRKRKTSRSDEEGPAFLSAKYAEPPASKIYNSRFKKQAPAELFRKDLISAMKLPDSEPLTPDDYLLIEDPWRPEWEKGVQVPVDPDALPEPSAVVFRKRINSNFKLPKKLIRIRKDDRFSPAIHVLSFSPAHADQTCRYDLDDVDIQWLAIINEDRDDFGLEPIEEPVVEKVLEEIECLCSDNMQEALRADPNLTLDSDEDALCDVCRSPDSEDGNIIVFCDACNICVHQCCYGITTIPEGSWICRTCALGIRPSCVLCPNFGGAMKPTNSGEKWCHVSCALWVPEVTIGSIEKMEPITKISHILPYRWTLPCSLCEDKKGVCIRCSIKGCDVAYHVTCAIRKGLIMKGFAGECEEDPLKLKSYCRKHTQENALLFDIDEAHKEAFEFNSEEKQNTRKQIIQEKESAFYDYAPFEEVVQLCPFDRDIIETIYNYWKLKRKANCNHPLLQPRETDQTTTSIEGNSTYNFMKKMVILRRDLERARNLCYMISKREKMAKSWVNNKHDIFKKQLQIISSKKHNLNKEEYNAVLLANAGDLAHDKQCTVVNGPTPNTLKVLNVLIGEENTKAQLNGILKMRKKIETKQLKKVTSNPYAKHYLNGLLKRSQRWLATADQHKWDDVESQEEAYKHEHDVSLSDQLMSDEGLDVSQPINCASTSSVPLESDYLADANLCNIFENMRTIVPSVILSHCDVNQSVVKEESDVNSANVDVNSANVDVNPANVDVNPANVNVNSANVDVSTANVDVSTADVDVNTANVDVNTADVNPEASPSDPEDIADNNIAQNHLVLPKPICKSPGDEEKKLHRKTKRRKFLNTEVKKNLNEHHKVVKKKKIKKDRVKPESETCMNGHCEDMLEESVESIETAVSFCISDASYVNSTQDSKSFAEDGDCSQDESVILECFVTETLPNLVQSPKCQDNDVTVSEHQLEEMNNNLADKGEICDIIEEVQEYPQCEYVIIENNMDINELSQNSVQGSEKSVESTKASLASSSPCLDSESENFSLNDPPKTEKVKKREDRFKNLTASRAKRHAGSSPLRNKLMNNHIRGSSPSSNKVQRTLGDNSVNGDNNNKQMQNEPKLEDSSVTDGKTDSAAKALPRIGSLTGYKIPKKPRSNAVEDSSVEPRKHSSPLSPLTSLSPSSTSTSSSYTSTKSYQTRPNKSFISRNLMPKFNNNNKNQQKPHTNHQHRESRVSNNISHNSNNVTHDTNNVTHNSNNATHNSSSGNCQWRMMSSGEEVPFVDDRPRQFPFQGMPPQPYHSRYPPPNPHFRQWIPGGVPNRRLHTPFGPNPNT